jgi:predicted nucleic acid-binding protein
MITVADTGPLNYLVLTGAVDVLKSLYGRVIVPQSVAHELQETGTPENVQAWIQKPPEWCEIRPDPPGDPSLRFLDPGERAALALALLLRADRLLIDEWEGRAEAERRHLTVTGTLGVLAEAHQQGLLEFDAALARLRQTNFYMSERLLDRVRRWVSTSN